jgi:hypothetical protein
MSPPVSWNTHDSQHLASVADGKEDLAELKLPMTFCVPRQTKVRLPRDSLGGDAEWETREEDWQTFWKPRGPERLKQGGKAAVNGSTLASRGCFEAHAQISAETFWLDVCISNPLDADVTFSNFTVEITQSGPDGPQPAEGVQVEVLHDVSLDAQETRTVRRQSACVGCP